MKGGQEFEALGNDKLGFAGIGNEWAEGGGGGGGGGRVGRRRRLDSG